MVRREFQVESLCGHLSAKGRLGYPCTTCTELDQVNMGSTLRAGCMLPPVPHGQAHQLQDDCDQVQVGILRPGVGKDLMEIQCLRTHATGRKVAERGNSWNNDKLQEAQSKISCPKNDCQEGTWECTSNAHPDTCTATTPFQAICKARLTIISLQNVLRRIGHHADGRLVQDFGGIRSGSLRLDRSQRVGEGRLQLRLLELFLEVRLAGVGIEGVRGAVNDLRSLNMGPHAKRLESAAETNTKGSDGREQWGKHERIRHPVRRRDHVDE